MALVIVMHGQLCQVLKVKKGAWTIGSGGLQIDSEDVRKAYKAVAR